MDSILKASFLFHLYGQIPLRPGGQRRRGQGNQVDHGLGQEDGPSHLDGEDFDFDGDGCGVD